MRGLLLCVIFLSLVISCGQVFGQKPSEAALPSAAQQQIDNRLADEIDKKLMDSNTLRPLDLGVWVHNGAATLSGTVPNQALRSEADALVGSVPGVKNVDDQLSIGSVPASAPGFRTGPPRAMSPARPANAVQSNGVISTTSMPGQNRAQSAPPRMYQRPALPLLKIPARTPLYVRMLQTVDSHHTKPGTAFRGILVRDLALSNGIIAIPRGAYVEGTVIDARPPGHLTGRPQLALQLSNVIVGRTSYVLSSYVWAHRGPGKGEETASSVAGGAGVGALSGAIAGGGPVALLGAAIGGLGGAGLSALSSGPHLVVPAEAIITFHLNSPLTVREPTADEVHALAANLPGYGYRRRRYRPLPPPMPGAPPGGYPY
ncbi:MAG TPA: BON domain-containing protein [Acidobacteriaceae bacterium]|nr:BON domain-containing protein [Acidobacteriaceae bacterium]